MALIITNWDMNKKVPNGKNLKLGDMKSLEVISNNIRADILKMTTMAKSGHPGGSMSVADIITALYFNILNHEPKNPKLKERDVFILSKGHCAPALYAALGACGYFKKEEFKNSGNQMPYCRDTPIVQKHLA